jgi:hypothetical protein
VDEDGEPRTRLEQLLHQRHLTVDDFREQYLRSSGSDLSERQAYRWVGGEVRSLPYPHACAALERLFGEPIARLLGPPYGATATAPHLPANRRGNARTDWQGQVVAVSADRARAFLTRIEASNMGPETLDQLVDDVRRLALTSQRDPLTSILDDLVEVQGRAFALLEGRQRPVHTRDLYLLAGIVSGLMAKASHDLGAPHDAMTQARAAYACAENAGHDGLRAWVRSVQSGIAYWTGRFDDAMRYAVSGREQAARSGGTASVRLECSAARALAAARHFDEANDALARGAAARDVVKPDDLDELGGLFSFSRSRELYFAAEALTWGGRTEAKAAERQALDALNAYEQAPDCDRAFGDEAGARAALAVSRIHRQDVEGAREALGPVLALPTERRIHGIVTSVEHVRTALYGLDRQDRHAFDLAGSIESFVVERLALAR